MASRQAHRRLRGWAWRLWVGYWSALFVIMHVPVPTRGPATIRHADKLIHFALYFLLTWLGGRYVCARETPAQYGVLLRWSLVYAVYAACDEGLQHFVEGRSMSFLDWVADIVGIAAATGVVALSVRRTRLSEPGSDCRPGGGL